MFENLDDPTPPTPAPIDGVAARGRRLRTQRRMLAGAAALFVLAGGIATAAALQGGGHHKVLVTTPSSSTTVEESTTVPEATSAAAPKPTTSTTSKTADPIILPSTTTSSTPTQPPHDPNDLSMVSVQWPPDTPTGSLGCPGATPCNNVFAMDAGTTKPLTYTITNNGSWTVALGLCGSPQVELWTTPWDAGFGKYSDGIWPVPSPSVEVPAADPCAGAPLLLSAGASTTRTETVVPGYHDAAGDFVPAPPGMTSFEPDFRPQCTQPCSTFPPGSLAVSIFPPRAPESIFTITVKTMRPVAARGYGAIVEMTYTNPLPYTVRTPVFGPCWTVKSGSVTVDCSGAMPALTVGPNQTVDLAGTVWATVGFTEHGAPLAPGRYPLNLGDLHGTQYALGPSYPYLTVS